MFQRRIGDYLLALRLRSDALDEAIRPYAPEEAPLSEDISCFVLGAPVVTDLFNFRKTPYVIRTAVHTVAWLQSYVECEVADLKANFCKTDKSFHIALLEFPCTGYRSIAFRLTTAG